MFLPGLMGSLRVIFLQGNLYLFISYLVKICKCLVYKDDIFGLVYFLFSPFEPPPPKLHPPLRDRDVQISVFENISYIPVFIKTPFSILIEERDIHPAFNGLNRARAGSRNKINP